jgi:glycosyltransferase involved in cell wall biosynthesis
MLSEDPELSGGIPRYAVPLAERLAAKGLSVDYVWTGGYTNQFDWYLIPWWKTWTESRVRYHGLQNPSGLGVNLGVPEKDVESRDARRVVRKVQGLSPDIIHVHSYLGFPFSAIDRLSAIAPMIVSVHEFTALCQRRVLVKGDGTICTTYPFQTECPDCTVTVPTWRTRLRARLTRTPRQAGLRVLRQALRNDRIGTVKGAVATQIAPRSPQDGAVKRFRARKNLGVHTLNRGASQTLAVSRSVKEILETAGVESEKVEVVTIGSESASRIRRSPLPCESGATPVFLCLGGLVPNKGIHVLIDALVQMDTPPRTLIAGRGSAAYTHALESRAPDCVAFLGAYDATKLQKMLNESDVVIAPSVGPDTSPQTVLEALAAGRPVIGSRIGGIPDFVADGVNGRLVRPDDPAALAHAIANLMDPDRVRDLAAGVSRPKTPEAHTTELIARYEDAVDGRRTR